MKHAVNWAVASRSSAVTGSNCGAMTEVDPIATAMKTIAIPEMWNSGAAQYRTSSVRTW